MKKQVIIGLITGLILINITGSLVQADIVTDIQAGISPQQVVQLALSNQLAPIQIVTQLITAGVNPITSAVIVARALPHEAIHIAVAAVAAKTTYCQAMKSPEEHSNCLKLVSQIAIGIADAVAEIVPDQREAIINAVAKAAPEPAMVIANFYPDPAAHVAHVASIQQEATITIPPPPALSQTNNCVFRKDCNYRDPRFPDRKVFLCCVSPSR
jgi:hypothetical protein